MSSDELGDVLDLTARSRASHDILSVTYSPAWRFYFAVIVAALGTLACYAAAGPSLGLFFGGFFVVTFLAPAMSAAAENWPLALMGIAYVVFGVVAVWLIAVFQTVDTGIQWAELSLVLVAYCFALGAMARCAARFGLPRGMGAALAVLVGLVWMTWPVWLSPWMSGIHSPRLVQAMVDVNPPLVANGVLSGESPWTEKTLAYQLTVLDQDVPIRLPGNAGICIGVCVALGLVFVWAGRFGPVGSAEDGQHAVE